MTRPETSLPSDFDLEEGYACFHPAGNVSLEEAVMLCKQAILFARKSGIGRLLIDATQLGGFPSPSVGDRYWIARDFAFAAKALVTVSFAFQPYLLDPERFGVTVATNIGMKTNVFGTKTEALAWLRNQPDLSKTSQHRNDDEGNSVQNAE